MHAIKQSRAPLAYMGTTNKEVREVITGLGRWVQLVCGYDADKVVIGDVYETDNDGIYLVHVCSPLPTSQIWDFVFKRLTLIERNTVCMDGRTHEYATVRPRGLLK